MDWAIVVVLQVIFQPSLSVLFTVDTERDVYESDFGEDVVLGCRFQPKLPNPHDQLKVTWHWIANTVSREVYRIDAGVEYLASQDPEYRGRVKLLTEQLAEGWARLQISMLRINDSGVYQCLVQTAKGADYKEMTLSVRAPYKEVTKHIQKAAEGDEVLLTCQSEGYPASSVTWRDSHLRKLNSSTTAVPTPEQLFKVTSEIRVPSSDRNNYTCNFTNDGYSATFHIPEELPAPQGKNTALIAALCIGMIVLVVVIAVHLHQRRKGSSARSTRNLLDAGRGRSISTTDCLQVNTDYDEEKTVFNNGGVVENLGAYVKSRYSDVCLSERARCHLDPFSVEEMCQRLHNNVGQTVTLQALLPEAGETLLLEGPPGSGKTTVAHILVACWTEGPTRVHSNDLDLSTLRLLLRIDCSNVKGRLFQEITTQLNLSEKIFTEDELRTSDVLLLLDEYKEGNQCFDESLKRFLSEKGGCRVLVTACPGHCPTLKDTVGTGGLLELHPQTVKY